MRPAEVQPVIMKAAAQHGSDFAKVAVHGLLMLALLMRLVLVSQALLCCSCARDMTGQALPGL